MKYFSEQTAFHIFLPKNFRKKTIMAKVKEPEVMYSATENKSQQFFSLEEDISMTKRKGRIVRVSMPYTAYKKLRNAYISQQIYDDAETQRSLLRAKEDINSARSKKFESADALVRSLDENA
jgi:hypothetical protein